MKRLVLLFCLLICLGCETKKNSEQITQVERVFMNEPGVYSFMYRDSGQLKVFGGTSWYQYNVYEDVLPGKPMWVKTEQWTVEGNPTVKYEIHVHFVGDIEGGGWNHGKNGSGTTTVVR